MPTQLIRGFYNLGAKHTHAILTIGNFDGVHRGHQVLLQRVKERAAQRLVPSMVIIFEPQPLEFFAGEQSPPRLMRFREKFSALKAEGVDYVLVLKFDQAFTRISARDFIELLYQKLKPTEIFVGEDFRFGYKRQGDFALLQKQGANFAIKVQSMPTFLMQGERVSSTRVRQALAEDNQPLVQALLAKPYTMQGRVRGGDQLGRQLGFPTANIFLHRKLSAVLGVYIVRVHGLCAKPWPGVANIGTRPAVNGTKALLEVHLLDFNQDIYGRYVEVEFCKRIRNEEWYPNLELLKQAIASDVAMAKHYFSRITGDQHEF